MAEKGETGMMDLEQEVLAARTDETRLQDLAEHQKQWILRCAAETAHHYVTDSDDEWSAALIAFTEAVQAYDPEKGPFKAFAAVVIRRRVLDWLRSERKYTGEWTVAPEAFEGSLSEEEAEGVPLQVQQQMAENAADAAEAAETEADTAQRTRDEIAAAQKLLAPYGFSFFDLADCSPKAEKTRRQCALAVRTLMDEEDLMEKLRRSRTLPMQELSLDSGVGRKVLDRHRRYIVAAAEILTGDFPILSAYLDFIRKVEQP